jgi:hypothetical protein
LHIPLTHHQIIRSKLFCRGLILFKILEYKTEAQIKFSIGNLLGTPLAVNYIPISESRLGELSDKLQARLNEGVTNVTARIQMAIGQTPAVAAPPPASQ